MGMGASVVTALCLSVASTGTYQWAPLSLASAWTRWLLPTTQRDWWGRPYRGPSFGPRSGTVVGESTSWTGRIPDGGPEAVIGGAAGGAVIPMASPASDIFVKKFAKEILNELMFARIGSDGAGATSSPNIVDASTNTNVTNNTIIRTPSPSGPNLHFERGDFVHKIA